MPWKGFEIIYDMIRDPGKRHDCGDFEFSFANVAMFSQPSLRHDFYEASTIHRLVTLPCLLSASYPRRCVWLALCLKLGAVWTGRPALQRALLTFGCEGENI